MSCAGWTGWPTNPPQTRRSSPTHRPAARRRPDAACLPAAPCHTAAPYPPAAPWHLPAPAVHRPLAASPPRRPRRPARPLFRAHARCASRGSPQSPPSPLASTSFHCRRGGGGAQHWLRASGRPSGRVHSHGNTASAAEKHAPEHAHAEWGEPAAAGGSAGTAPACRPDVAQPLGAASQLPPLPRGWGSHNGAGGTRRAGGADGGPSPPPASKGGVATVFSGSPRVPLALYSVSRRIIQPLGGACMRVSWSPPPSSTQSRAWRTTGVSSLSLERPSRASIPSTVQRRYHGRQFRHHFELPPMGEGQQSAGSPRRRTSHPRTLAAHPAGLLSMDVAWPQRRGRLAAPTSLADPSSASSATTGYASPARQTLTKGAPSCRRRGPRRGPHAPGTTRSCNPGRVCS